MRKITLLTLGGVFVSPLTMLVLSCGKNTKLDLSATEFKLVDRGWNPDLFGKGSYMSSLIDEMNEKLQPLTTSPWKENFEKFKTGAIENEIEGYQARTSITPLEKTIMDWRNADQRYVPSSTHKLITTSVPLGIASMPVAWGDIEYIEPIDDSNAPHAYNYKEIKIADYDAFIVKTPKDKYKEILQAAGGFRRSPYFISATGENIGAYPDFPAGTTGVVFSIDETEKSFKFWCYNPTSNQSLPTLLDAIPNWNQDKVDTTPLSPHHGDNVDWNTVNPELYALRRAVPGINPDTKITPDIYLQLIKYFYPAPAPEQTKRLNSNTWLAGPSTGWPESDFKRYDWRTKLFWNGEIKDKKTPMYNFEGTYRGYTTGFIQQPTSPLTWSFDDYTINYLNLGNKELIIDDLQNQKYSAQLINFATNSFYTHNPSNWKNSSEFDYLIDNYKGDIKVRSWIFENIFYGLNVNDNYQFVLDENDGMFMNRHRSFYERGGINSIPFLKDTYRLFVTTKVSEENPNDQIINYVVKYAKTGQIVYRDSMLLSGMQPDLRALFNNANWTITQNVIDENNSNREIDINEFMTSLLNAQDKLKYFEELSSDYLLDGLIGKVVDSLAKVNFETITTKAAQGLFDKLKLRTDINLNFFINTVNKSFNEIQQIVIDRNNNHYALSLNALQLDNVINVMLATAKEVVPELFNNTEMSFV